MQRKFNFAPGEYYHLYNRGNDKRQIFLNHSDYFRFLLLLYAANHRQPVHLSNWQGEVLPAGLIWSKDYGPKLVDIGAYCLMPNHFHLLVREKERNTSDTPAVPIFMQKLLTGHSMYFNKKYGRSGKLFEGPFKATHADDDRYLKYLFAYIHLNPVKSIDPTGWVKKSIRHPETAKEFLNHYEYSSYPYYSGRKRLSDSIINAAAFPGYFSETKEFSDFIQDWINFSTD